MKLPQLALFGCLLVSTALIVQADQFGDFPYTTNDAGITITGYTGAGGAGGAVVIPGSIDGVPVTRIGGEAFLGWTTWTSVSIPETITSVGSGAFSYCFGLRTVTIPASVTNLQGRAFAICTNLQRVFFKGNAPSGNSQFYKTPATVFYLPNTTGWGDTYGGLPAVLWNPLAQTDDGSFGVGTNGFGFNITGTTNIPIVVEAAPSVVGDAWVPLLTNTLATGSVYFSDPDGTNRPARFYRIRSP